MGKEAADGWQVGQMGEAVRNKVTASMDEQMDGHLSVEVHELRVCLNAQREKCIDIGKLSILCLCKNKSPLFK